MSDQEKYWSGPFGKNYLERNPKSGEEVDRLYLEKYGIKRSELNEEFLGNFDKNSRILEVGVNCGSQLELLENMGFKDLWGIDVSQDALAMLKKKHPNYNVVLASAVDIPFKNNFFDIVFTSGVLIHIHEKNLGKVIDEIVRVSKKYVFGFEYFSNERTEIEYRGNKNLLWKDNFVNKYIERYHNINIIKRQMIKYKDEEIYDEMFLLELRP